MAQVNATVGDLTGNADKIVEWTRRAGGQGTPGGRVPGDDADRLSGGRRRAARVVPEQYRAAVREVAERLADEGLGGIAVVTGYLGAAKKA